MTKAYITLQQSEAVIIHAASRIYAAYIATSRVPDGEEAQWMERSIREAIQIAEATDAAVISDDEVDANETTTGRIRPSASKFGQ